MKTVFRGKGAPGPGVKNFRVFYFYIVPEKESIDEYRAPPKRR
jgi:hypothetical protein